MEASKDQNTIQTLVNIYKEIYRGVLNPSVSLETALAEKFALAVNYEDLLVEQYTGNNTNLTFAEKADLSAQEMDINGVNQILEILEELTQLLLNKTEEIHLDYVTIPPDQKLGIQKTEGKKAYRSPEIQDRVQSLTELLALLNTPYTHSVGIVSETMMRELPYHFVEIPAYNRIVVLCDENGNITFVFDTAKLESLIAEDDLVSAIDQFTKDQLKEMINQNPGVAQLVRYNKNNYRDTLFKLITGEKDFSLKTVINSNENNQLHQIEKIRPNNVILLYGIPLKAYKEPESGEVYITWNSYSRSSGYSGMLPDLSDIRTISNILFRSSGANGYNLNDLQAKFPYNKTEKIADHEGKYYDKNGRAFISWANYAKKNGYSFETSKPQKKGIEMLEEVKFGSMKAPAFLESEIIIHFPPLSERILADEQNEYLDPQTNSRWITFANFSRMHGLNSTSAKYNDELTKIECKPALNPNGSVLKLHKFDDLDAIWPLNENIKKAGENSLYVDPDTGEIYSSWRGYAKLNNYKLSSGSVDLSNIQYIDGVRFQSKTSRAYLLKELQLKFPYRIKRVQN